MKLHAKKVPRGHKLRVRRYDGQNRKIYAIKIFDVRTDFNRMASASIDVRSGFECSRASSDYKYKLVSD